MTTTKTVAREEITEILEAMALIQTLPQMERTALQYYIKGAIAAMSGQLPIIERHPPHPPTPAAAQVARAY